MNGFSFRKAEREAFKIAKQLSLDTYEYPPNPPLHTDTIKMILAAEHSLKDMWKKYGILIPAASKRKTSTDILDTV